MTSSAYKLIPATFRAVPSLANSAPTITPVSAFSDDLEAIGFTVAPDGDVPAELAISRETLAGAGFDGKVGQTLVVVQPSGAALVAVGSGLTSELTAAKVRDSGAAFARAVGRYARVGIRVTDAGSVDAGELAEALTEGVILARYRYTELKSSPKTTPLAELELSVGPDAAAAEAGIRVGQIQARSTAIARDLASAPPGHLTATDFGEVAEALGAEFGLTVEIFDKQQLIELGCGGLLGVNAGSVEEPRMVQVRYVPASATGHLALVGKGITYDSGGISLKPTNPMHAAMKMDMAGAGAALAAMTALRDLECSVAVTAFLMCTDNMPSGSATKLGDVLTIRGGTTVEVKNTDAEGRLVMADALVLAAEESPDAIIDIATLTGAAVAALGTSTAAVFGNNQALVDQATAAATATDEPLWQLPLESKYRPALDSDVADISNVGGTYAGATTAALFLNEFVGAIPWAHLDIAGPMMVDSDDSWRSKGATGFGARSLLNSL